MPASAQSSSAGDTCAPEPPLADWRMSAADRKRLEGPLNLSAYQLDFAHNRGVSHVDRPSAPRGLLSLDQKDPLLLNFLELMCHNRDMRERLFKSTWYDSELIKVREDTMLIRELAFCPLDVVRALLLYFPKMRICARSAHFDHGALAPRLRTQLTMLLDMCDHRRLTLVHTRPDGEQVQALCPASPPADLQWRPM